jgi:hypothetical protein
VWQKFFSKMPPILRSVAQLGSASRSGREGRWFESSRSDQIPKSSDAFQQETGLCAGFFMGDRDATESAVLHGLTLIASKLAPTGTVRV